jgi:hypothetical protein
VLAPASEIPIPTEVALGHHACFGTLSGWPSRQPASLEGAILLLNAAIAASGRRIDFLHIPTLGSADDAFFAPLQELRPEGARVYIGAIHHLHGAQGLSGQLKAVRKYLPEFGLAAPCGWGRAPERPGRLLSEQDGKIGNPVDIIVRDHKAALDALRA